jgi:hypothetical protein
MAPVIAFSQNETLPLMAAFLRRCRSAISTPCSALPYIYAYAGEVAYLLLPLACKVPPPWGTTSRYAQTIQHGRPLSEDIDPLGIEHRHTVDEPTGGLPCHA